MRFTLGMVDEPELQRQSRAVWAPGEQGPLLVLGVARSGRSTVLATIAEQAMAGAMPVQLCGSSEPEAYWDALCEAADPAGGDPAVGASASVSRPTGPRVILFDDWDAVFARWPLEYQSAAGELLGLALRDGPRRELIIAIAASMLGGAVQTQSALFGARLLLRQAEKSEHLRAGGRSGGWRASAPAGRGEWLGLELQSAAPNPASARAREWLRPPLPTAPEPLLALDDGIVLIISTMPSRALAIARERAASAGQPPDAVQELGAVERMPGARLVGPLVIVGDPDAWQSRWGLFAELRPLATIAFHECRLSDYRTLSRLRELPPLLVRGVADSARVIAVDRDGRARRARLA